MIGLQVVTVGQHASEVAREWFEADRYQDYVRLHGLGVELAEALAEYVQQAHPRRAGLRPRGRARSMSELLKQGYRGSRYSLRLPGLPEPRRTRSRCSSLLGAERIGVELSDDWQLHPEQSTSAIVLHHPQARYFNV